jgi:hypothetical protein
MKRLLKEGDSMKRARTYFRKLSGLRALIMAGSILPMLAVAPLAHATANNTVCNTSNGGNCWELNSAGGAVIDASGGNPINESINYYGDPLCGGNDKVTATCPFADPNLSNALIGHTIVSFKFNNFGSCADSTGGSGGVGVMIGGNCTGSHAAYILVDNNFQYISVGDANSRYNAGAVFPNDATKVAGVGNQQLKLKVGPDGTPNQNFNWSVTSF